MTRLEKLDLTRFDNSFQHLWMGNCQSILRKQRRFCMTIQAKRILIPLSRRRKFIYSCGTLTIFVFSAELVLMLMGFENPLHTRDPYLGFSQTSKLFSLDQTRHAVFRTVSTKHRYFNPQLS